MKTSDFHESNVHLRPPSGMEDDCGWLHIWTDGHQCISRWQPTKEEIAKIVAGEPIWLTVVSGHTQPPIGLSVECPFQPIDQTRN